MNQRYIHEQDLIANSIWGRLNYTSLKSYLLFYVGVELGLATQDEYTFSIYNKCRQYFDLRGRM
jgi:hypothetical protein